MFGVLWCVLFIIQFVVLGWLMGGGEQNRSGFYVVL